MLTFRDLNDQGKNCIIRAYIISSSNSAMKQSNITQIPVTGCADVLAPDHAWHKREGNLATVGCEHEDKTWHLNCVDSKWDGVVGSCKANGE